MGFSTLFGLLGTRRIKNEEAHRRTSERAEDDDNDGNDDDETSRGGTPGNECAVVTPDSPSSAMLPRHAPPATLLTLVRQEETWDCGVACLQMVFSWLAAARGDGNVDPQQRTWILEHIGRSVTSLWTVDLAHILDLWQNQHEEHSDMPAFDFTFCSAMLEPNPAWRNYAYYAEAFASDQQRTVARLRHLQRQQGNAKTEEFDHPPSMDWLLQKVVDPNQIAIVLVDNSCLRGCGARSQYAGHYVVLTGVSTRVADLEATRMTLDEPISGPQFCFVAYNPALGRQYMSPCLLEAAWHAPGTDQDVIWIRR
jgi:hypothetical protein